MKNYYSQNLRLFTINKRFSYVHLNIYLNVAQLEKQWWWIQYIYTDLILSWQMLMNGLTVIMMKIVTKGIYRTIGTWRKYLHICYTFREHVCRWREHSITPVECVILGLWAFQTFPFLWSLLTSIFIMSIPICANYSSCFTRWDSLCFTMVRRSWYRTKLRIFADTASCFMASGTSIIPTTSLPLSTFVHISRTWYTCAHEENWFQEISWSTSKN